VARLRIGGGDGIEQTVELREQKIRIGRGRDNDIVLADPQKGVSRVHAELRYENGRYVILDLQSQNGTWVNGRRVERAEVPLGAEIALGEYRLTLHDDTYQARGESQRETRPLPLEEFRIRDHSPATSVAAPKPAATAARVPAWVVVAIAVTAIIAVAGVMWVSRTPPAAQRPSPDAVPPSTQSSPPASAPAPASTSGSERPAADERPDASPVKRRENTVANAIGVARVARKPDETAEAWRARSAALQMRYGYSKAALDRGDFAAAAGGFEAILLEEPGFLDAPKLLVQAQAGLRATARNLFQAGTKLDEMGDWVGALQKYEQARQIYAGVPGLSDSLQRVRGKLRAAGTNAFNQARQHEANGRKQDALKEYEKALQWLPSDDPNRHIARARVDQLKKH
jgi:pSer/pThr/pTyr-binding forkhead associated (FHA) protein